VGALRQVALVIALLLAMSAAAVGGFYILGPLLQGSALSTVVAGGEQVEETTTPAPGLMPRGAPSRTPFATAAPTPSSPPTLPPTLVPLPTLAPIASPLPSPTPAREATATATATQTQTSLLTVTVAATTIIPSVKPGDTLADISTEEGTTGDAMKEADGLGSNQLPVGQELIIPAGTAIWLAVPTATTQAAGTSAPVTPSAGATSAATPSPTAAQRPAGTGGQYPAPVLASPVDGELFRDRDPIPLTWQPVGQLGPDDYYVTTVAYLHLGETWYDETPWTKETHWTLSEHRYLLDLSDNGQFRWAAQVMRRTGIDDEGRPLGIAVSPSSEVRTLIWEASTDGDGRDTPAPPGP
jgi:LysM repeat protein